MGGLVVWGVGGLVVWGVGCLVVWGVGCLVVWLFSCLVDTVNQYPNLFRSSHSEEPFGVIRDDILCSCAAYGGERLVEYAFLVKVTLA